MGKKARNKAEKAEQENQQEQEEKTVKYAAVSDRFFAAGIDLGLLYFIVVPVSTFIFPYIFTDGDIIEQAYQLAIANQPELADHPDKVIAFILDKHPETFSQVMQQYMTKTFIQIAIMGAFIIPFIHLHSATPGKMIVGISVVDSITYKKISFGQSVIRFLSYIPAMGVVGLGIFWANFNIRHRGWHDYLADTVVILNENRWYKKLWNKLLGK